MILKVITTTKPILVNINQLTFLVSIPYSTMNHISPPTSPNNQSIQPYPDPNCMMNTCIAANFTPAERCLKI